jgi:glutamyl-tRNA reductase
MKLFAAGISQKTAPLELREQLSVQGSELVDLARALRSRGELDEVVLLSTCNRLEIYGTTQRAISDIQSLFQLLCSEVPELDDYVYLHQGVAAARHLLRVAAGLDSMMLGETEITGQVKSAYEIARTAGLTGRVLNRLFQRAFQTAKEIRTRTGIGRGAVSIKGVAVGLLEKIFGDELASKSIMVIGAGQMAESCVRLLASKGVRSIFVSNRSFDRAIDLALRCGAEAVCFGYCLFEMREVDAVIVATSSAEPLLNREDIEHLLEARHHRPLLLIDLSVPRNIEPAVGGLKNISLYNLDNLEATARRAVRNRERELAACGQIIDAHVAALINKLHLEDERCNRTGRSRPSHHPLELSKNIRYKLAIASSLVVQPS